METSLYCFCITPANSIDLSTVHLIYNAVRCVLENHMCTKHNAVAVAADADDHDVRSE